MQDRDSKNNNHTIRTDLKHMVKNVKMGEKIILLYWLKRIQAFKIKIIAKNSVIIVSVDKKICQKNF